MKRNLATLFVCLCLGMVPLFAQTQTAMNSDAGKAYEKANAELNKVYQKILSDYKTDIVFVANLKAAQRLWIQFRDAEVKARYPARKEGESGSAEPMCVSQYLAELTEERTRKLNLWLTGIEEGDVCSGSVKMKQ